MRIIVSLVMFAACAPPTLVIPVEQIPTLQNLDQVMHVQATYADPQFKKIGAATLTDTDWTELQDLAVRIQATSIKAKEFSRTPGFTTLAGQLHTNATTLAAAVSAKNVAGAKTALEHMRATCRECHKQYR